MSDVSPGLKALTEFGFELSGPREPTPGMIAYRLGEILQRLHTGLRTPQAAAALKTGLGQLERLVLALDAYDAVKLEEQEGRERTLQFDANAIEEALKSSST